MVNGQLLLTVMERAALPVRRPNDTTAKKNFITLECASKKLQKMILRCCKGRLSLKLISLAKWSYAMMPAEPRNLGHGKPYGYSTPDVVQVILPLNGAPAPKELCMYRVYAFLHFEADLRSRQSYASFYLFIYSPISCFST